MVTNKSYQSYLIVSANPHRRAFVAEALRAVGAVSVEAVGLQRAQAIPQQLRFDVLAIDFIGLGAGVVDFLDDLSVDHPETRVFVVSPPIDGYLLALLEARRSISWAGGAQPNQTIRQVDDKCSQYDDALDGRNTARLEWTDRNAGLGGNGRQE